MAISTYTELQAAVADWLNRSDLTSQIQDFIALAELRLMRTLRVRAQEGRSTTALVAGQNYYALPDDFLAARNVQINKDPVQQLEYKTPQKLDEEYPYAANGLPQAYTIIGCEMQIKPTPQSTDDLEIAYFKRLDPLSDANPSNWLTTNAPDLLLYGALLEAEPFLKNDKRLPVWDSMYRRNVSEINRQDKIGRHSGSVLVASGDTYRP